MAYRNLSYCKGVWLLMALHLRSMLSDSEAMLSVSEPILSVSVNGQEDGHHSDRDRFAFVLASVLD